MGCLSCLFFPLFLGPLFHNVITYANATKAQRRAKCFENLLSSACSFLAISFVPGSRLCFPYFISALFAFLGPHPLSFPGASLSAKYFSAARVAEK
uniref:Uncharacterized protein LOC108047686 n=1 Tax=Drosophila rhopaloa TaxID=1041015 RepID=A0A6P4EZA4_DRORH